VRADLKKEDAMWVLWDAAEKLRAMIFVLMARRMRRRSVVLAEERKEAAHSKSS
jgi:hypothetical protein